MSEGILKFTLPEERDEFEVAVKSSNYKAVLDEIDTYLRNKVKYEQLAESEAELYTNLRRTINDLREEYGIPYD